MFINVLTFAFIALILGGVGYYAYRRATKVWREDQARQQMNEAALLAEVSAGFGESNAIKAAPYLKKQATVEDKTNPRTVAGQSPATTVSKHEPMPDSPLKSTDENPPDVSSTVEDDIRKFLGEKAHDNEPSSVTMDDEATLSATTPLDAAIARLVSSLRDAADKIERTATNDGTDAERAAHTFGVASSAIGKLPLSDLLTLPTGPDSPPNS